MGTGFCSAIYHGVSEASGDGMSASLPAIKPPLPPPLEMVLCEKSTFYACWVSISVVTRAVVANGLWCAVPLR